MKNSFRKQLLLQLSIAGGIVTFFIVRTAFIGSDVSKRADAIRALKNQDASERRALQSLIVLTEQEKRAKGYTAYLNGLFPAKDGLFTFRNQITTIGKEEKLVLGFKFGTENRATDILPPSIDFQISIAGPLQGFRKLMDRLESGGYFIRVNSFDVLFAGRPGAETFTGSIKGKVFYRG
ncbi:MAG: hypothetical protein AAB518_02750 [Patescibacteria group bacterium]